MLVRRKLCADRGTYGTASDDNDFHKKDISFMKKIQKQYTTFSQKMQVQSWGRVSIFDKKTVKNALTKPKSDGILLANRVEREGFL